MFFANSIPPDPTTAPPFAHVAGSSYAPAVGQPPPAPPCAVQKPTKTEVVNWLPSGKHTKNIKKLWNVTIFERDNSLFLWP